MRAVEEGNRREAIRFQRREPLFHPELWSCHARVIEQEPRTTNALEGWHHRFGRIVDKTHPHFYEFYSKLIEEEAHTRMVAEKIVAGEELPRRTTKWQRQKEARLATLFERYAMIYAMTVTGSMH